MEDQKLKHHEVEVKFRIDEDKLSDWKLLVRDIIDKDKDNYIEQIQIDCTDIFYIKKQNKEKYNYQFIRHRFSDDGNSRAELTTKKKLNDSNNIIRKEWNIRVDNNEPDTIRAWIEEGLGYNYGFSITKFVHIYIFKDATLPFYTVIDESGKRQSFIEIEVNEELLESITEDEAWEIIKKYEKLLEPLEITAKNRLRLSLFEIYGK